MDNNDVVITNNFLTERDFAFLSDTVTSNDFPWFFSSNVTVHEKEYVESSPGIFVHIAYINNAPRGKFYHSVFLPILKDLDAIAVQLIRLNLNNLLPEPYTYMFHTDLSHNINDDIAAEWTTSILYINTNNGYTEFEDAISVEANTGYTEFIGDKKIKSEANRLVTFPANLGHRGVTQTDEQSRIVINFNYLKRKKQYNKNTIKKLMEKPRYNIDE